MSPRKSRGNFNPFDWIPYIFGNEEAVDSDPGSYGEPNGVKEEESRETPQGTTEESGKAAGTREGRKTAEESGEATGSREDRETPQEDTEERGEGQESRKGGKEGSGKGAKAPGSGAKAKYAEPVSFRTANEPLSVQQRIIFAAGDVFYALKPLLSCMIIMTLCALVGYPLTGWMARDSFQDYLDKQSNLLVAVGVILTFRHLYRKSKKGGSAFFEDASLFYKGTSVKKILLCLLFGAGASLFLSSVLTLIPRVWVFATYEEHVQGIYRRYDVVLTILESAILTPLVEEIIFRGYMLNRLLRRWPELPALIVTTLVFALMHGTSLWMVYAFAMGWIIGWLSIREGNIFYGIFLHAGFNMPSVVQWFYYLIHPTGEIVMNVSEVFELVLTLLVGGVAAALTAVLYLRMRPDDSIDTTSDDADK